MNYEQELKKYDGTLYAQAIEATKRMIYRAKWCALGEVIPEEFFWEIFRDNMSVYIAIFNKQNGGTYKDMMEMVVSGNHEKYVDTMIDFLKNSLVDQATDEQLNRMADLYLDIRKGAEKNRDKIVNDFNKWQQNDTNSPQSSNGQQSSAIAMVVLVLIIVFIVIVCAIQ